MRNILLKILKCLKARQYIRNVVPQHLGYESHMFLGKDLRVYAGADTDAIVNTLITIVVKPPWIDSVTLYVSQQDSAPCHRTLKTQDMINDRKFLSLCHVTLSFCPPLYY
ncbi:unnamed protein product [Hymenolepis diminuta]|uniref:Uncharacterized protein n=1 Tax=Hymenolepis diminuta TaxID=6216 RepID=A0A564Z2J8_HYMDI|nr:unnamed protein product [Hymenolepis diminuta]